MTTIRVSLDDDVDAIQRIALPTIFGSGFPNYPAYQVLVEGEWVGVELEDATHAVWDDYRLNGVDVVLCSAIAADSSKLPQEVTSRAQLLELYPVEVDNG